MTLSKFKNKYRIKSARLAHWDYSANGAYFITICTKDRKPYFGNIQNGKMVLSPIGKMADQCWYEIPDHFPIVVLDQFIVMPNHVHGIVIVETQNFASLRERETEQPPNKFGPQSKNLASIIRGYKIGVKKWATMNKIGFSWQSRFYDHIIRNEKSGNRIRKYIANNPLNWEYDRNREDHYAAL